MKRLEYAGQRIGELTVIERAPADPKGQKLRWLCLCDCGKTKAITTADLKKVRSCGCLKHRALPNGLAYVNRVHAYYVSNAKNRNYEWDLSFECFESLVSGNCYYCGEPPSVPHRKENKVRLFNGVDRIENDKGYVKGNCVSCCRFCNIAKNYYTSKEFIERCCRVAAHSGHRIKEKE
jgi:hypothetical protein